VEYEEIDSEDEQVDEDGEPIKNPDFSVESIFAG